MKRAQLEANVLILVTLGLVAFGLVMVYSATSARAAVGDGEPMHYLLRQSLYALAGLVALVVCARTPYTGGGASHRRSSFSAFSCSRPCSLSQSR